MERAELGRYCASLPGATWDFPFGPEVRVFRAGGKIFALVSEDEPLRISLKCDPALAEILRANHAAVTPGYHLNKRHWNTVLIDGTIPAAGLRDMVRHSYELVVASLPRARRPG